MPEARQRLAPLALRAVSTPLAFPGVHTWQFSGPAPWPTKLTRTEVISEGPQAYVRGQVIPDGLTLKRRIVSVCLCAPEDSLVPANPVRTGGPERRAQPSVHCWKQDINVSPGPNVRPSPLPRGSQCQTSARV